MICVFNISSFVNIALALVFYLVNGVYVFDYLHMYTSFGVPVRAVAGLGARWYGRHVREISGL